ncbi:gliding motility lipoprotein GldH [Fulvivirga sedimenti]|uniref:Gliding motility lipoprotein GldH n=1 Tax=Fulvivirga sedimenti TaxID=2879465 RepID=A0A9X1HTQ3_9BACT|nr:gliding motility lipoprotein GldH [Fulvivirga sedimenti]MCA6078129.1 gliding motility lipoprotein GldH [Fulvivirga sedimenti]
MIKYILQLLIVIPFLVSCDNSRVYEVNNELSGRQWLADSTQSFTFSIPDTSQKYNVYYNLRNSVSYPFRNIYVKYSLTDSTGEMLEGKLDNANLFDAKSGKPLGDGLGDVFDHQFPLLKNYGFPAPGQYRLEVSQYMRRDTLPEIVAVGVRVEKATATN